MFDRDEPFPETSKEALPESKRMGAVIDAYLNNWSERAQYHNRKSIPDKPATVRGGLARYIVEQCGATIEDATEPTEPTKTDRALFMSVVRDDTLDILDTQDSHFAQSFEVLTHPSVPLLSIEAVTYLRRLVIKREQIALVSGRPNPTSFDVLLILDQLIEDLL